MNKIMFLGIFSLFIFACSDNKNPESATEAEQPKTLKEETISLEKETETVEKSVDSIINEIKKK